MPTAREAAGGDRKEGKWSAEELNSSYGCAGDEQNL